MKNLFNKIIAKFKKPNQLEEVAVMTYNQLQNTNDNLIAIARLSLIKPEALVREARNVQANGEYLLRMVEVLEQNKNDNKGN